MKAVKAVKAERSVSPELALELRLTRDELREGLRKAPGFRRQLLMLACLSLPTTILLLAAPPFRWWMVPPVLLLLAAQAYRVPARTARRMLGDAKDVSLQLLFDKEALESRGAVVMQAPYRELRGFGESGRSFQFETDQGLIVIPKQALSESQRALVRGRGTKVPTPSPWPIWAMLALAAMLAAAILLGLQYAPEHGR